MLLFFILDIPPPTHSGGVGVGEGGGLVGTVAKSRVGELGYEVKEVFSIHLSKYFTGVFQGVSGKRMFLVRFQDRCEKYMTSNQITNMPIYKIPVNEEAEVSTIYAIPDETVGLEKGYYNGVYVLLKFKK